MKDKSVSDAAGAATCDCGSTRHMRGADTPHDTRCPLYVDSGAAQQERTPISLLTACRLALQQFEFMCGERKRGWDVKFLKFRLTTAIEDATDAPPQPEKVAELKAQIEIQRRQIEAITREAQRLTAQHEEQLPAATRPPSGEAQATERTRLGYDPVAHAENMEWLKKQEAERINKPSVSDDSALIRPSVEAARCPGCGHSAEYFDPHLQRCNAPDGPGRCRHRCEFKAALLVTTPCNCPVGGECANQCQTCQYNADNAWDCDHQGEPIVEAALPAEPDMERQINRVWNLAYSTACAGSASDYCLRLIQHLWKDGESYDLSIPKPVDFSTIYKGADSDEWPGTVFEKVCLREIADFCERLTKEHRRKQ